MSRFNFNLNSGALSEAQLSVLRESARKAADFPLVAGESAVGLKLDGKNGCSRLELIGHYLDGRSTGIQNILISKGQEMVGYAALWDGWIPFSQDQTDAMVELAFLDPKYGDETREVQRELRYLILDFNKGID